MHINDMVFSSHTYEVTPRYMIDDILQPLDDSLTVSFPFNKPLSVRWFSNRFYLWFYWIAGILMALLVSNNKIAPNKTTLLFPDIKTKSGPADEDKTSAKPWPRKRLYIRISAHLARLTGQGGFIIELLDETINDNKPSPDVLPSDETGNLWCHYPVSQRGWARIVTSWMMLSVGIPVQTRSKKFDELRASAQDQSTIARVISSPGLIGKVFLSALDGKPVKVPPTGSTSQFFKRSAINA